MFVVPATMAIKSSCTSTCRSFGVLLYEVVTFGEKPYNDYEVKEIVDSAKNGVLKLPRY